MRQLLNNDKLKKIWFCITQFHAAVRDSIIPSVCLSCKEYIASDTVLCISCKHLIMPVASCQLSITATYNVTVFSISRYEGIVQQLIRAKQARKIYAARALGVLIWECTDIRFQEFDCIVPVPLHWRRYALRGYNQAEEIAQILSEKSGKPIVTCLCRVRATAVQASLPAAARRENVSNAFDIKNMHKQKMRGKRILLVDDVLTTGSTIEACVRALRSERPLSITIAVGSRVV